MSICKFVFAHEAIHDMNQIHCDSTERWGERTADRYIADIQKAVEKVAQDPERGKLRSLRAKPFMMVAVRQHFVVYHRDGLKVIILAILHQRRDIENILADLKPEFFKALADLN